MTGMLALLAAVAFVQNAAFTMVSRSRNSGDVSYHALAAVLSNSIWFACQVLIVSQIWRAIDEADWGLVFFAGLVYTGATVAGSCAMMWHMLRTERGKRRVGARAEEKGDPCDACGKRRPLLYYCDGSSNGPWCRDCFSLHPCETEHEEGCATMVISDG